MSLITRRTRGVLLCLILAAVALPTFAVSKFGRTEPTDWPQYRGKNRDGISTEKSWLGQWPDEGPKTLWKASVGVGFSAVSVSNGRAITMGNTQDVDTVYCFDALTGRELWKYSYPCLNRPNLYEGGPNSTPTVSDVHVYTLSRTGQLFCLDAASGKPVWAKDLQADFGAPMPDWGFTCSPLVVGNMLFVEVGGKGASVVAFNKATGEVLWKSGNDRVAYSSPVALKLGDDACLACFMAPGLVVLKGADGSEVCRHLWKTLYDVNAATPIITGDRIFLSSGYDAGSTLVTVGKTGAMVLWQNKNMRNHFNSSVLWDGHLYGFDESPELRCIDVKDGSIKWSQGGLGKGSLMLADGKLIVLSEKGELVIAEAKPAGFSQLARTQILGGKCWTVPVLSDGRIYARNAKGDLVCVDVKGKR